MVQIVNQENKEDIKMEARINLTEKEMEKHIKFCQEQNHIQQVAFSTYHHALTQICFSCDCVRTSMKKGDLE